MRATHTRGNNQLLGNELMSIYYRKHYTVPHTGISGSITTRRDMTVDVGLLSYQQEGPAAIDNIQLMILKHSRGTEM